MRESISTMKWKLETCFCVTCGAFANLLFKHWFHILKQKSYQSLHSIQKISLEIALVYLIHNSFTLAKKDTYSSLTQKCYKISTWNLYYRFWCIYWVNSQKIPVFFRVKYTMFAAFAYAYWWCWLIYCCCSYSIESI